MWAWPRPDVSRIIRFFYTHVYRKERESWIYNVARKRGTRGGLSIIICMIVMQRHRGARV